MSSASAYSHIALVSVQLSERRDGELRARVTASLPSVEPSSVEYFCDPRIPEERSSFYDDIIHAVHIETQLFGLVLEAKSQVQLGLL